MMGEIKRHKLLHIKQMSYKDIFYSTGGKKAIFYNTYKQNLEKL